MRISHFGSRWLAGVAMAVLPAFVLAEPAPQPPVDLAALIARAQAQNPDVRSAYRAWRVAEAQVGPAGTWPDPTFSYIDEKEPASPGMDQTTVRHYQVVQPIPFPGKLSREAQMKRHETLIAESQYRSKLFDVVRDLRLRYFELYLIDQRIALARQSVEVLRNAMITAQNRLGAGKSSALDVFLAQTELHKTENMLFEQEQQRKIVTIAINTLLNQPNDTPLGVAAKPAFEDLPVSVADLHRIASQHAPEYARAMHEVNHARTMTHRNRLQWAPDFSVMYEKEVPGEGQSGRQIGVGVTVPLWFRKPLDLNRAAAEHEEEARAMGETMQNMTRRMVDVEAIEVETHLGEVRRFEATILPSALSALRTARQQYASGQTDFIRLLEAVRSWLDAHWQYQGEIYHYGEHWSELSRWIGVDLSQAKTALSDTPKEMHHAH